MDYTYQDIDKISNYKSWNTKKKIDALLYIDSTLYSSMGVDSTLTEKELTKIKSRKIYKAIGKIDIPTGQLLLQTMD
tara:strand:- start:520 stop:750 length:231 start_codon:yes stop_codon:yes gene_type:complete